MEYSILYVLTVKCTTEKCEEDLEYHVIRTDDENAIYTDDKSWKKSSLMEIEVIENEKEEIIVRIPFVIKEVCLIALFLFYILRRSQMLHISKKRNI